MKILRFFVLWLVAVALAGAQAPSNDSCSFPISLEIGINPGPPYGSSGNLFSNVGATFSSSPQYSGYGGTYDVFFALEASCTGTTRVSLCTPSGFAAGSTIPPFLHVFTNGSCISPYPTLLSTPAPYCSNLPQVTFPSTEGGLYLVRVASGGFFPGSFYLTVQPTTANAADECATATSLAAGPNVGSTECASPSNGAFLLPCGTLPGIIGDVWRTIVAPFDTTVTLTLTGSGADNFAVYSGSCGSLTPVACAAGGTPRTLTFPVLAGETHHVRIWQSAFAVGQYSFQLDVQFGQQAASDSCATAAPVLAGVNPAPPFGAAGAVFTNAGAINQSGFSDPCGSGGYQDVFFTYVSEVDGVVRVSTCTPSGATPGSLVDTMLAIYASGACSSATPVAIACNDDACGSFKSNLVFNATFGTTYLIRVSSYYAGVTGTFHLTIDPSTNDACLAAAPLSPGVVNGTTAIPTCVGCSEAWYAFTPVMPCDIVLSVFGHAAPAGFEVYLTPDCTNFMLYSGYASQATLTGAAPFTTLWIKVLTNTPGGFTLSLSCPTPPPNDEPAGAIPLTESTGAGAAIGSFEGDFHNFGATQSAGFSTTSNPVCGTPGRSPRSDVFFSYTTAYDGPVMLDAVAVFGQIFGLPIAPLDTTVEIYAFSAAANALLACNDDAAAGIVTSSVRFTAVAGTSYLVRVATSWDSASTAPGEHTTEGTFKIRVTRPFAFDMDAPFGPGSIRLRNLNGPPFTAALTVLTLFPGNYPYGFFFGIDPTFTELQLALSYGAPFTNFLDANGSSAFVAGPGLPSFTLYGVTLLLNAFGQPYAVSAPESFTIP